MKRNFLSRLTILAAILLGWSVNSVAQSTTFNYSGAIQAYTVPAGVTAITVTANGAQGGSGQSGAGGLGANMSGVFTVTPGDVLNILVGGQGQGGTNTGGGGGGSFVWDVTTGNTLLIAAGAGGGGGRNSSGGVNAVTTNNGTDDGSGDGGAGTAGNGGTVPASPTSEYGAGGAGWFSNGANGNASGCSTAQGGTTPLGGGAGGSFGGTAGVNGSGGFGGGGGSQGTCQWVGGGGGGGYSGGAGGGGFNNGNFARPGGGGGSFNGGTSQSNSVGNGGNGIATICAFPAAGTVTGTASVCVNSTTTLSNPTASPAGTWSSSDPTIATIGSSSGIVTGVAAGVVTIVYTTTNTCGSSFATAPVTVNPLPAAITGVTVVCAGSTTTLADGTTGGTWSSSNTGLATVGSATGIVTGVAAGLPTIMYTLTATGCMASAPVTVNPLPSPIIGTNNVCVGSSTLTLNDYTPGGTWSSGDITIATVGSTTGVVTGVSVGNVSIAYTLTATGCFVSRAVTVNALPVVSGGSNVAICLGASTPLSATGGDTYTWSPVAGLSCTNCSDPVASPTVTTTYTVTGKSYTFSTPLVYKQDFVGEATPTTQCTAWQAYRASLLSSYTYTGFSMRGSNNPTGISCTDPVIATAIANAMRTGTAFTGSSDGQTWHVGVGCQQGSPGCGTVAVELTNRTDCFCAFSGNTNYTVRPAINNSNWGGIAGVTCGASSQTMEVDFYIADGCSNSATVTVTVNPLPNVYNVTGGGSYCAGGTGVPIGLDSSNAGFSYQVYHGLDTSGTPVAGIDTAISFGLRTAAGTYTVVATDTTTGCKTGMNGTDTVVIIPLVFPTVTITKNTADTICAGTTTTFTASSTDGGPSPVYIWKVNGGTAGTDSTAYAYVPTNGNLVNVLLVSSAACPVPDTATSDTFRMTVLPNGTPTIHLTAVPGDTVCEGSGVTIRSAQTFGGHAPSYTFIKNTVIVGSDSSFSFIPVNNDQVYAIMISDYLCRLATFAFSNAITMDVESPIVPSVSITGYPGVLIGPGKPDTLVATVTDGGVSPLYQWYINTAPVPGATTSVLYRSSYTDKDSVSCKVTRQDACGLSSINSVVIHIGNVGVQPLVSANMDIKLIPNPNKGAFALKGSLGTNLDEEASVEVTDMLGQVIYRNKVMATGGNVNETIQLSNNIANGMYMLTLHSVNGTSNFRFVTEK